MQRGKVLCAMSGGVDSSVTTEILLSQGYSVSGMTMKLFDRDDTESECYSMPGDIKDASDVASILQIPWRCINLKEQFDEFIIKPFIQEYCSGRTPNPCIRCNELIKFSFLLKEADSVGSDFVATGHYARTVRLQNERYALKRAKEKDRDQSYFLYRLDQKRLSRILFPLGEFTKTEVRHRAKRLSLKVDSKPDSQEICFIKNDNYKAYVHKQNVGHENRPGNIIDENGKILGEHKGIHCFTIGQRRGIGVSWREPLYVKEIIAESDVVVVGPISSLKSKGLIANEVVWTAGVDLYPSAIYEVKIRSKHSGAQARVMQTEDDQLKVEFLETVYAVSPGQSAVVYLNDEIICGGVISKAVP